MDNLTPFTPSVPRPAPRATRRRTRLGGRGRSGLDGGSGWRLFRSAPAIWIVLTVVFIAIMIVLSFIPFLGQIASTLLSRCSAPACWSARGRSTAAAS